MAHVALAFNRGAWATPSLSLTSGWAMGIQTPRASSCELRDSSNIEASMAVSKDWGHCSGARITRTRIH